MYKYTHILLPLMCLAPETQVSVVRLQLASFYVALVFDIVLNTFLAGYRLKACINNNLPFHLRSS